MNMVTTPGEAATATLARRIADFAVALEYNSIPPEVRERARIQMLDGIGVGLASNAYSLRGAGHGRHPGRSAAPATAACSEGRSACRCATPRSPMAS